MTNKAITTERDQAQLRELSSLPALDTLPDDALVSIRVRSAYSGEPVKSIYNRRSAGSDAIPSVLTGRVIRYRVGDIKALLRRSATSAA